jgi:hypothetical protein
LVWVQLYLMLVGPVGGVLHFPFFLLFFLFLCGWSSCSLGTLSLGETSEDRKDIWGCAEFHDVASLASDLENFYDDVDLAARDAAFAYEHALREFVRDSTLLLVPRYAVWFFSFLLSTSSLTLDPPDQSG